MAMTTPTERAPVRTDDQKEDVSSSSSSSSSSQPELWYGPFHRLKSPTQSDEVARQQLESGEMWGRPRQFSEIPQVQAYIGKLEDGREGMEFMTSVAPDKGTAPGHARWTGPRDGVRVEEGFAKIPITIVRNAQQ
mmetsp:Transcript_5930/g.16106  ORF Transcript_5930/g.16106 Transcript_5930/m.16106 type:complete len:135 (+) Transcript_5930:164-568(+)